MEMNFTDANFVTEVEQSKGVVMVDFYAEWCGPCKQQGPIIEKLATEYAGKAKIGKMDVDQNPETGEKFGIMSIPTLIIFKDGKPLEPLIGLQQYAKLKATLDSLI
jgi:thioredoxin 1